MKFKFIALTTVVATIGLTAEFAAVARTPSQEFFEQGWQQLEQEIQILQGGNSGVDENLQPIESQPLLEVNPSPSPEANQQPDEVETPSQQPDQDRNESSQN